MSVITVCLDCPNYEKGGWCRHGHKTVAALAPACDHAKELNKKFDPENEEATMTKLAPQAKTKTCTKCGRELPISEFYAKAGSKDGLQTICKECHNEATKKSREKKEAKDGLKPPTKLCKRCGRELPLVRFGKNASTKDGLQYWCKECQTRKVTEAKAKKRAAEDSFLGKSEPEPEPLAEALPEIKEGPVPQPTPAALEGIDSVELVRELRARGYTVEASRPITVIERL